MMQRGLSNEIMEAWWWVVLPCPNEVPAEGGGVLSGSREECHDMPTPPEVTLGMSGSIASKTRASLPKVPMSLLDYIGILCLFLGSLEWGKEHLKVRKHHLVQGVCQPLW